MKESGEIEVSKKTLMHISEGIYRTSGSAVKELISNSFDANASKVVISTNYPLFDVITCQDDGEGMTEAEFLRIVKGGIGDSKKATIQSSDRPVIGRLGIGVLAIAQICRSFTIISHHRKTRTAFKGRMVFRTDVDKLAKTVPIADDKNYEIGKWELLETMEYDATKGGVLIFTKDLRQAFHKNLTEGASIKNKNALNFEKLLEDFSDPNMIKESGTYSQLLWELCNMSPLTYYSGLPIKRDFMESIEVFQTDDGNCIYNNGLEFLSRKQEEISSYNFTVIFDNIRLFRPISLPSPSNNLAGNKQQSQLFYLEYNKTVRARKLRFHGYFTAQETAVKPRDLNGVQIRIKNVGIGMYDPTFLKYEKLEAPRDKWISGEIYVEEGLESALNIDRDSFNENDEHYYILKQQLHIFLRDVIFPVIKQYQRKRSKSKKDSADIVKKRRIEKALFNTMKTYFPRKKVEFVGVNRITFDNDTVKIPENFLSISYVSKLQIISNSLLDLIEHLKEEGHSQSEITQFIQRLQISILA